MKKMLNRGFTLVELIVVTMLMGIITTAVVMIIQPTRTIYNNVTSKSSEEDATIILTEYLNAELRYSSNLTIVCNDETDVNTILAADTDGTLKKSYDNFIMISNNTRSNSKKGARGYTEKGVLSNPSKTSACVSESLLDEFDYQFSIADYCTDEGNQSVTLGVVARTMVSDTTTFIPNPDFAYEYEEAFQLLNIQESIGGNTEDFDVIGSNSTYSTIWIFYKDPESTASSSGSDTYDCNCCSSCTNKAGCTCGCSTCICPTDSTSGATTIVTPTASATKKTLNLYIQLGNDKTLSDYSYEFTGAVSIIKVSGDGTYSSSAQTIGCNNDTTQYKVYIDDGGEFTLKDTSGNVIKTYTYDDLTTGTNVWVYDNNVNDAKFSYGDEIDKTLIVYMYYNDTIESIGFKAGGTLKQDGLSIDGISTMDDTNYTYQWPGYPNNTDGCVVKFTRSETAVVLDVLDTSGNIVPKTYEADKLVESTTKVWFFAGVFYEDWDDCYNVLQTSGQTALAYYPDVTAGTLTIHAKNDDDSYGDFNIYGFATNGYTNTEVSIATYTQDVTDSKQDITVNYSGIDKMYLTCNGSTGSALSGCLAYTHYNAVGGNAIKYDYTDGGFPTELWYYNGYYYTSEPDGYDPGEMKEVTIHWVSATEYAYGQVDKYFTVNGTQYDSADVTEVKTEIYETTTLTVSVISNWSQQKVYKTYSYSDLDNDIYIFNAVLYTDYVFKTVNVHWSSSVATYDNNGTATYDSYFYLNGTKYDSSTSALIAGDVTIDIYDTWNEKKQTLTISNADLPSDIYIMGGQIYTSQPSDWVE
ncbi:MAG: type II secretion system GspH family protein [Ruminococcus sp.]|nr:type II secretion system GspH family protein [Ruminococcus sp.]